MKPSIFVSWYVNLTLSVKYALYAFDCTCKRLTFKSTIKY